MVKKYWRFYNNRNGNTSVIHYFRDSLTNSPAEVKWVSGDQKCNSDDGRCSWCRENTWLRTKVIVSNFASSLRCYKAQHCYLLYLHRLARFCTYTELLGIYTKHRTVKDYFGHALWFSTNTGNSEIMPAPLQPTEYTKNHKTCFSIPYKKAKEM